MSTSRQPSLLEHQLGRREFLAFGVGAFTIAGLPLALSRRERYPGPVHRTLPIMGTVANFAVVHRDPREAHAAIDAAMAELQRVERLMTRFTDTSDIGRANLGAARDGVIVSAETAMVVAESLRWSAATNGTYDPAVGGMVRLWDVINRHEPPPAENTARLAGRQLHLAVDVGTRFGSPALRYHDPDVVLDLGSIAKGYAVDRAVLVLRQHGIEKAVVVVGGDLYALGSAADDTPWRIGVQDPNDDRQLAGEFDVTDGAVVTAGTYRRYFRYRGERYHHLMDPMTAAPRRTAVQSFTVRADSCMHADVAATALFSRSIADANRALSHLAPGASVASRL
jgi:thiamine biosynthesis lipoprotein